MKRYKLLKDLVNIKAGTIIELNDNDDSIWRPNEHISLSIDSFKINESWFEEIEYDIEKEYDEAIKQWEEDNVKSSDAPDQWYLRQVDIIRLGNKVIEKLRDEKYKLEKFEKYIGESAMDLIRIIQMNDKVSQYFGLKLGDDILQGIVKWIRTLIENKN